MARKPIGITEQGSGNGPVNLHDNYHDGLHSGGRSVMDGPPFMQAGPIELTKMMNAAY